MNQFEPAASNERTACTEDYSTPWIAPTPLPYSTPYMTPFPTYNNFEMTGYANTPAQWQTSPAFNDLTILPQSHISQSIERPRSSPSSFGPLAHEIQWPENPLGIHYPMTDAQPNQSMPSAQTIPSNGSLPSAYHTPAAKYATPSPPQRRCSADAPRQYQSLAPHPDGLAAKRAQEQQGEDLPLRSNSKRRKRTPSLECLSDEDRLVCKLWENHLPWKEIVTRFASETGQQCKIPALQMRKSRALEKVRIWEEHEAQALKEAHEWYTNTYDKRKWDIISDKMCELGVEKKWPAKFCKQKWSEITPQTQQQRRQSTRDHTPQQQIPMSQQHTPPPQYATLVDGMSQPFPEGMSQYGYGLAL